MLKLIMTKGLPGSGKTRFAKQYLEENPNTVLVCKDDLRAMMFNSAWTSNREKLILKVRDYIIQLALRDDKNVVVHDTNFAPKHEERFKQLAAEVKAEFEIQDFTDVPIEQCIHNDLCRPDSVGEKVIRDMYRDWLKPKPPVVEYVLGLPEAIIIDLDGSLALFGNSNPYDRDFENDVLNKPIINIIDRYNNYGTKIILVSGRDGKYREITEKWLKAKSVPYDKFFMRVADDKRKDVIIKSEIYKAEIEGKYNILFAIDDRKQVKEFWVSIGIFVLDVNQFDLDF